MDLKGTKTEENLKLAFSEESQMTNKYLFYASQARKEGYEYIAEVLEKISNNEKAHSKVWFEHLYNGLSSETINNLDESISKEKFQNEIQYLEFAKIAKDEGFNQIAMQFEIMAEVEKKHELILKKLLNEICFNEFFTKEENCSFECLNCGYTFEGKEAIQSCPICSSPQSFFKVLP